MAKHHTNLLLKMDSLKPVLNPCKNFAQVTQAYEFKFELQLSKAAANSNSEKFLNNSDNCLTLESCSSKSIELASALLIKIRDQCPI